MARGNEVLVLHYLDPSSTYIYWNQSFFREVQDWELESLFVFLDLLYSLISMVPSSREEIKSFFFNILYLDISFCFSFGD